MDAKDERRRRRHGVDHGRHCRRHQALVPRRLRQHPTYHPRAPIVGIDDSDVICFLLPELHRKFYVNVTTWKIMMNTKDKTLLSVCRYDNDVYQQKPSYGHTYIPCKISTLYTNHSSNNGATKPPVGRQQAINNYN